MAITIATLLTAAASTTNATSYTTASQSPAADRLLIATVNSATSSGQPNNSTVTGNGLTWVRLGGFWHSSTYQMNIMLALTGASTPSAGALTLGFSGQTQQHCLWHVAEVAGAFMGGHPFESIKEWQPANYASGTVQSVSLTTSYETGDANYASLHGTANTAITCERTEIADVGISTPTGRLAAQYHVGDDNAMTFTVTGGTGTVLQMRIIAAENAPTPANRRVMVVGASKADHRASSW